LSAVSERQAWLAPVSRLSGGLSIAGSNAAIGGAYQSAISLLAVGAYLTTLVDEQEVIWGAEPQGNGLGRLTIRRASNFDVVATGGIATAMGLTLPLYTGANSYVGTADMPGSWTPSGLRLDGPLWESEGYRPTDAAEAATGASWRGVAGSVLIADTWARITAREPTLRGQVIDVAHAGRWVGRMRVTDITREWRGQRDKDSVVLRLSGQGVS